MSENITVIDADVDPISEEELPTKKLSRAKILAAVAATGAVVLIIASKIKSKHSSPETDETVVTDDDTEED